MTNRRKHRIPIFETIFSLYRLLVFHIRNMGNIDGFGFAVSNDHLFSFDDIALFKLLLEPLIDLVLRLCTLNNIQPVTTRSFGILGCQYLNTVTVLDLIVYIYKFTVDSGTDHLITDSTMNRISEINRC